MAIHSNILAWRIPWMEEPDRLQFMELQRIRPLLCLEGVPDLPVAPQDEANLTKTFQTWPRGWFHIP